MKVLMISADNFEDTELLVPYYRLKEENIDVQIASIKRKPITGKNNYEVQVDLSFADVRSDDYDMLIVPGGKAPAKVREDKDAIQIARKFFESNKPVAAICHGAQVLVSAGVMEGRHATCWPSVAEELKECGARYEDKEVIVDGNLITSRNPSDLPAFMREIMKMLRK